MIIGVEGIDGSGKSTLVQQLKDANDLEDAPIFHCFSKEFEPPWTKTKEFRAGLNRALQGVKARFVHMFNGTIFLDRTFVSGMVYSRVFGNKHPVFDWIQRTFGKPKLLYFIDVDPEVAYRRTGEYDVKTLTILRKKYLEIIESYYVKLREQEIGGQDIYVYRYFDPS